MTVRFIIQKLYLALFNAVILFELKRFPLSTIHWHQTFPIRCWVEQSLNICEIIICFFPLVFLCIPLQTSNATILIPSSFNIWELSRILDKRMRWLNYLKPKKCNSICEEIHSHHYLFRSSIKFQSCSINYFWAYFCKYCYYACLMEGNFANWICIEYYRTKRFPTVAWLYLRKKT